MFIILMLISLICLSSEVSDLTEKSDSCDEGYYGINCDKQCPSGCTSVCNRDTGICAKCKDGLYGSFCNNSCPINCYGGYCDKETGRCFDCKHTFSGESCQNKCPENCLSCNENQECSSCVAKKHGPFCNATCPTFEHCVYDNFYGKCIDNCKLCTDNYTCDYCYSGFYGRYCEKKCPENCETCDKSTGNCLKCQNSNSYGNTCQCKENQCASFLPTGRTMDFTCVQCRNDSWYTTKDGCCPCSPYCKGGVSNCNTTNGVCLDGCVEGHYGEKCDIDKCSEHCAGNNVSCNEAGECPNGCDPDWYTARCNLSCSIENPHCKRCYLGYTAIEGYRKLYCAECDSGYYDTVDGGYLHCTKCKNCLNDRCNKSTGFCLDGCVKGWYNFLPGDCTRPCTNCAGGNCNSTGSCLSGCIYGYYGYRCHLRCPRNCKGSCDAITGHCSNGCKDGYYGNKCYKRCNHCASKSCHQKTGYCEQCEPEWYGDTCSESCKYCLDGTCYGKKGCARGCKVGHYGNLCTRICLGSGCAACEKGSGRCLICENQNLTGHFCQEQCSGCGQYLPATAAELSSCRPGTYGLNCEFTCSTNCSARADDERVYCDRYTGSCLDSCKPGLHGLMCDKICGSCELEVDGISVCNRYNGSCESCKDGFYNSTCDGSCPQNCRDKKCHIANGACLLGCNSNWGGESCKERLYDDGRITAGQLIGITVGIVVVAIFVIPCVIVLCCKRRRHKDTGRGEYSLHTTTT